MWQAPQAYYGVPHVSRPPAGPVPKLMVAASVGLVVAMFVPFVSWSAFSISIQLSGVDLIQYEGVKSAGWMYVVVAGIALALLGSLWELAQRPVARTPRGLTLAGFLVAVLGLSLGLLAGPDVFGLAGLGISGDAGSSFALGFWASAFLAVAGSVMALVHIGAESNQEPEVVPAPPSWGPPAGYASPFQTYPAPSNPGFPPAPPAYGPPVYPDQAGAGYPPPIPATPPPPFSGVPMWLLPPSPGADPRSSEMDSAAAAAGARAAEEALTAPPDGAGSVGHLVVVESGRTTNLTVAPGEKILVGRSPEAQIRVSDPRVGERHATIERRGHIWVVEDIDPTAPTHLVDAWGMRRQVRGEFGLSSGQLAAGDVLVTLYPDQR
jgi:hypothetical protein